MNNPELQAEYDRLTALVLRLGAWLTGPKAQLLPRAVWEEQYARYGQQLERLRELGDQLRPVSLRERVPPSGDTLISEVIALFAE